ncbi:MULTISPECIES: hypothetical protein [Bacillus]|nr:MULTISPECIES: hypothetical protein [Bacillus]EJV74900.1 hypothetical protein IGE_05438 [Bacillus cereus HuB1-1]MED3621931.1 hypothetical protein [Bacillus thuringiensis]NYS75805.1 hypothetical protein [Bacillus sp. BH32]
MIDINKDVVAIIASVFGIVNVGLDIHSKVKKLQQNKKRSRNKRKRK